MRILFISDIFGKPGRNAVIDRLPSLVEERTIDFVVANGENAASGAGITSNIARKLLDAGVDLITTGNHVWRQREVYSFMDESERIIRPFNYLEQNPGRGWAVVEKDGMKLAVVNLLGDLYIGAPVGPFQAVDEALAELPGDVDHVLVDMHAEATSEKVAMGYHLDGRVSAVIGTHTHIQTADEHILPGGTAYITDAGMTGPHDSVIGVDRHIILKRFLTQMPVKFEVADGGVRIEGVTIDLDGDGHARVIERLRLAAD